MKKNLRKEKNETKLVCKYFEKKKIKARFMFI